MWGEVRALLKIMRNYLTMFSLCFITEGELQMSDKRQQTVHSTWSNLYNSAILRQNKKCKHFYCYSSINIRIHCLKKNTFCNNITVIIINAMWKCFSTVCNTVNNEPCNFEHFVLLETFSSFFFIYNSKDWILSRLSYYMFAVGTQYIFFSLSSAQARLKF